MSSSFSWRIIVISCSVKVQVSDCTCTWLWKHVLFKACLGLVVVCHLSDCGGYFGPPTAFLRRGTGVPWVSLPEPTSVPQIPGWLCGRAPTHFVLVGVRSCRCRRVRSRGRVSRSFATENTYTPARLEALLKLSIITICHSSWHDRIHSIVSAGCGCFLQWNPWLTCSSSRSRSRRTFLACCLQCRNPSCSRNCKSVSLWKDWSTSVYLVRFFGSYCYLRDGRHAVLRVSSVMNILKCFQSAKL